MYEEKKQQAKLLMAFKAEIDTIIELIETRKYINSIENILQSSLNAQAPSYFRIPISINLYTKTFEAHLKDVAMLPERVSKQIIRFYMLIFALSEDLSTLAGTNQMPFQDFLNVLTTDIQLLHKVIFIGKDVSKLIDVEASYL